MANCIICDKEIMESSEEHIIPFALGNKKFTTHSICKKCNSLIGEKIDVESTNNILAQMFRQQNGIAGHSGSIPNAFAKGKGKNGEGIRVSEDMKPTLIPQDYSDENHIQIKVSSVEEGLRIIEKKLKRKGLPPLTEEQKQKIREIKPNMYQPEISYKFSLNINKIYLEWIKIAFETLYYLYGEEILLETSILQLRTILYDYLYLDKYDEELVSGKINILPGNLGIPLDELKQKLNDEVIHLVQVISENNVIGVFLLIEGMLKGMVKITVNDSSKYNSETLFICYPSGRILK